MYESVISLLVSGYKNSTKVGGYDESAEELSEIGEYPEGL
jgi:hypothetical protein